jgi:hypothetical protein
MLPIIGFPNVVGEFDGFFRQVFSWNQFRSFKQYLSGLITGRKVTVRSIVSRLVDPVDQSSLNRAAENYVFDARYLSKRPTSHKEAYGKGWILRLKANK